MTLVMTKVTRRLPNRAVPRDQLRERIFAAAIGLFREGGYDSTTVDAVARAASVAKGTVFNFFPTKGAILLAHYQRLDAQFATALGGLSPAEPRASLVEFFGRAESLMRREGTLVESMVREIALDATLNRANEASTEQDRRRLGAFFRAARAQGAFDPHVDPVASGHVVADLWTATAQHWVRSGRNYSLKRRMADK